MVEIRVTIVYSELVVLINKDWNENHFQWLVILVPLLCVKDNELQYIRGGVHAGTVLYCINMN